MVSRVYLLKTVTAYRRQETESESRSAARKVKSQTSFPSLGLLLFVLFLVLQKAWQLFNCKSNILLFIEALTITSSNHYQEADEPTWRCLKNHSIGALRIQLTSPSSFCLQTFPRENLDLEIENHTLGRWLEQESWYESWLLYSISLTDFRIYSVEP